MVNYEFPPLGGGSGNATRHMLQELAADPGLRIDLVTSGIDGESGTDDGLPNVKIHRIPIAKRQPHYWTSREMAEWFVRAVGLSRRLVARNRYDLCHCWSGWPSGWIGYLNRKRIPYMVALRGSDVPGYNRRLRHLDPHLLRPISRRVWRAAKVVTSVSTCLSDLAKETLADVDCEVIHNGVDGERFHPGTPPEPFTVLFVGRLIERKAVDDLLEAFRQVSEHDSTCRLRVVGAGPEQERLEALSRELGLSERVSFLGRLENEMVQGVYQKASLFVMPAIEEAMSNAALEAMACGLPVITTPTGVAEIIDGNGVVVPKREPGEIADAILRYVDDPDLCRRHGLRSREISEGMTWSSVASAYRDLYLRVLKDKPETELQLRAV